MSRLTDKMRPDALKKMRLTSRTELWTWVLVTAMTMLIWVWAAGETQEDQVINYARIQFTVPEPENWVVGPHEQQALTLVIEGSRQAIQAAEALLRRPLSVSIPAVEGEQNIDILERLRTHEQLRQTGAKVTVADPNVVEVKLDKIIRSPATVKAVLPNVRTEGDVVIDPPEVTVSMPGDLRERLPSQLTVEAVIDRAELERLE